MAEYKGLRVVDPDGNGLNSYDLETGYVSKSIMPKADAVAPDGIEKHAYRDDEWEWVWVYREFSEEDIARAGAREEQAAKNEAREAYLSTAPKRMDASEAAQADTDDALCELYEQGEARQAEFDDALCAIYEMQLGGAE